MIYTIPFIPPSNNKFIGRRNNWEYRKVKAEWEQLISWYCQEKPKKPYKKAIVTITYTFNDNRRRDPDNYSGKFILDGLVKAGIIEDDSFDNIILILRKTKKGKEKTVIGVERNE